MKKKVKNKAVFNARYWLMRMATRLVIPFRFKVFVHGRSNVPAREPFILVANHRYDLDAFVIAFALRKPVVWVAADFLENIPFTGRIVSFCDMITVTKDEGNNYGNIKKIVDCLRMGFNVGIFPEGMDYLLNAQFDKPMADFYPGFAKIAIMLNVPVFPVIISPIKERVRRYPIPRTIRKLFDISPELKKLPVRNSYDSIDVHFQKLVWPDMKLPKAEAFAKLSETVRVTLESHLVKA